MKLLLLTALVLASPSAFAKDSLWLLCKGTGVTNGKDANGNPIQSMDKMAVSLFDSRFEGSQRKDTLKWIFGGRQFDATIFDLEMVLNEKTPAKGIEFSEDGKAIFRGEVSVALKTRGTTLTLLGAVRDGFDDTAPFAMFSATLTCDNLSD
jgi:hypothetical protein